MSINGVNYGYGCNTMNTSQYSDIFKKHYGNFQPSNKEPDKDYSPAIATGFLTGLAAGAVYLLSKGKFKLGSILKDTKPATPEVKLLTAGERSSQITTPELKLLTAGERNHQLLFGAEGGIFFRCWVGSFGWGGLVWLGCCGAAGGAC